MKAIDGLNVDVLTWSEASKFIKETHPVLFDIINQWQPDADTHKFYKVKYHYGDTIYSNGKLHIPLNNRNLTQINNRELPNFLQEDLSYCPFPVGIILNHVTEVYTELDERTVTLAVFGKSIPIGLLETLEPKRSFLLKNIWSVSAGVRSIFMLPKISDKVSHERLQKALQLESDVPRNLFDQFRVFREIEKKSNSNWTVDLLFFSKAWFEKSYQQNFWVKFYLYLHEYMFEYSGFSRNKPTFDFIWHYFAEILTKKNKKPDQKILETLKNLAMIGMGAMPGFAVCDNNEKAPISNIQNAYMRHYSLSYAPTLMAPTYFNFNHPLEQPVYYSLRYPSMFDTVPKMQKNASLINQLCKLRTLLEDFEKLLKSDHQKLSEAILNEQIISLYNLGKIRFDFFHTHAEQFYKIQSTEMMPKYNKLLNQYREKSLKFASNSNFLRSCISLSYK